MRSSWRTAAGLQYLQLEPDSSAATAPVIIALHGRGADPTDLAGLAAEVGPEHYRWVLPQGPLPVPLGPGWLGWAWYQLEPDRAATVVAAREQLGNLVSELAAQLDVPRTRMALTGFSQGGAMALHVGLTSPEPFAGVAVMSGYLPAAETLPDLNRAPRQPVLMVHGTADPVLAVTLARQARDLLQAAGLEVEYEEYAMGHQITPESLAKVRSFILKALPPNASPRAGGS